MEAISSSLVLSGWLGRVNAVPQSRSLLSERFTMTLPASIQVTHNCPVPSLARVRVSDLELLTITGNPASAL